MKDSLMYPRVSTMRRVVPLDGFWSFQFDPESKGVADGWADGLPEGISMPVPSSFCDLFTDKDSRDYCGDFWYETDFFVPQGKSVCQRGGNLLACGRLPAV